MEIKNIFDNSNSTIDSVELSEKMIYDILKWISEQNTILSMPYTDGETNIRDETELHGFGVETEYTSTHINVYLTSEEGTVYTTRNALEYSVE
jgi:hypothetical protein